MADITHKTTKFLVVFATFDSIGLAKAPERPAASKRCWPGDFIARKRDGLSRCSKRDYDRRDQNSCHSPGLYRLLNRKKGSVRICSIILTGCRMLRNACSDWWEFC
jgi:hypothetical protein